MTRRDTVIIAVLINAGILIVLFTSALKGKEEPSHLVMESTPPVQAIELSGKKEITSASGDEVDHMLKQYSQNSLPVAASDSIHNQVVQTEQKPNFVNDLNAIAFGNAEIPAAPPLSTEQTVQPSVEKNIAAAPQAVETPKQEYTEVRVKKGDVLEKIARANQTTVDELMKYNHLTSTRLRIGQVLKVPGKGESRAGAVAAAGVVQYYTVKNGDSPWTIAHKNHIKLEELLKLNNLDQDKARRLKPGDKLRIR